jgi:carboxyl-terminal processing protease
VQRLFAAAVLSSLISLPILPLPAAADPLDFSNESVASVPSGPESEALDRILRALRQIRGSYVDPISDRELADIAIEAMAKRDRYSQYLPPAEYEATLAHNDGTFTGIGIRYEPAGDRFRIVETMQDSPAAEAGLKVGDIIDSVDGQPIAGQEIASLRRMIGGPAGVPVTLTVSRDGLQKPIETRLVRRKVAQSSVKSSMLGTVGYIRIRNFDCQTYSGLSEALDTMRDQKLTGLVLDLRDNPGGLVSASVKVADALLEGGPILTSKGRDHKSNRSYTATPGDESGGVPVAVLVNGRSASASEILAGALKDHGRATVVGTRTFGKGVIQTLLPQSEGSAIKLTTARYYTPSGASIHGVGITPDIVVPDEAEHAWGTAPTVQQDVQLARALEALHGAPKGDSLARKQIVSMP